MNVTKMPLSFFLCAASLLVPVLCIPVAAEEKIHGSCSDCHGEYHSLKAPTATDLCLSCHPGGRADHRLVQLRDTMTTTLPLDASRTMTCLTCHEPHGKGEGRKMLRKPNDALCLDCHQK